jgi:hypothetical protein
LRKQKEKVKGSRNDKGRKESKSQEKEMAEGGGWRCRRSREKTRVQRRGGGKRLVGKRGKKGDGQKFRMTQEEWKGKEKD